LESLSRLTIKFGFGPQGIQLDNTVEFAIKNLENSSNEVRQAASDLILEALKLEGEQRIEPMLESSPSFTLQTSAKTSKTLS
jgi:hypothetical protein